MTVFHADLDNTLIYSVRHDVGEEKTGVEVYEGREVSFMTNRSSSLLKRVKEHLLFVPTTTRTEEQYRRIDLKMGPLEYALEFRRVLFRSAASQRAGSCGVV